MLKEIKAKITKSDGVYKNEYQISKQLNYVEKAYPKNKTLFLPFNTSFTERFFYIDKNLTEIIFCKHCRTKKSKF